MIVVMGQMKQHVLDVNHQSSLAMMGHVSMHKCDVMEEMIVQIDQTKETVVVLLLSSNVIMVTV